MKRFVAALGEQLSLTSEEIADILWLAVQMGELPQPVTSDSSESLDTGKSKSPQQIDPPLPKDSIDLPNPESSPPPAEIRIPEGSNLGGGLAISVPDARSLREPLELARSLKPLLQRVASGWSNVLDEEATILKLDRDRVWLPVLKPNLEAWLDLVLVVDESVSMQIWQRTISELQRFLAHYGVFRDVRVYSLVVENERAYVRPRLGAASQGQSLRNPQELIDPSGRRLILVATDCVSAFWRSGEVLPALKLWAKSGPMAIVQMLPEWLWGRSGLGLASAVRFAALQAGIPNHQLKATNLSLWDDVDLDLGIKVPVVTLEPAPMKTWAQLVAGKGGIQSPGFVFDPEPLPTAGEEQSRTEGLFVSAGSGEERVRRFQVTASPMARQLAMILAAAPTISLPIVRILQDRLLPRSQQVHVAEVFLGGLLKPLVAVDPQSNPDLVPYEFMDGARDVLLDSAPTTEVVNVMQEVSQFVAERLGLTLDAFMGVLRNPQETGDLDIVSQSRPFALMAAQILRKLGGGYAQLAQELEQANQQVPSNLDSIIEGLIAESENITTQLQLSAEVSISDNQQFNIPTDCKIRQDVSLKGLTTWKVGGAAEWYLEPFTLAEIQSGLAWAIKNNLQITVIGAGSNLLISDRGLAGLVICTRHLRHVNTQFDNETLSISVDAGKMIGSISWQAARRGWSGLEWAAGIPGTVGGVVVMNAGAHGHSTQEILISIDVLNLDGSIETLTNRDLNYSYRTSDLQGNSQIVLSAKFQLPVTGDPEAIKAHTFRDLEKRHTSQPYDRPSCGSVFRNPVPQHAFALIKELGLQGYRIGGAEVSTLHANFIINRQDATASEIRELIYYVQSQVKEKYSIELYTEFKMLGEFSELGIVDSPTSIIINDTK
jgi:UDP-N-acetylenolpyruvoylglucosamine reductase